MNTYTLQELQRLTLGSNAKFVRVEEVEADLEKLEALESAGVDNWEGYDHAMHLLREIRDAKGR